ncbi:MAG: SDR family oxidoreductase [Weeksellaceae bacterium]
MFNSITTYMLMSGYRKYNLNFLPRQAKKTSQKTYLITGASSDIGAAIARALARPNTTLILTGRNKAKLKQLEIELQQKQTVIHVCPADLRKEKDITQLIKKVEQITDSLDGIIHTAGIYHYAKRAYDDISFADFSSEEIIANYMVTTVSLALLVNALLTLMKKNSSIIAITGTFENGAKGWLPYFAAKKALEQLIIGLTEELADKQIQAFALSPSDTLTESYKTYFPQYARVDECLKPEDIAIRVNQLLLQTSYINGSIIELYK